MNPRMLTARQTEVLEAIRRLTREQRRPPTYRELMSVLGISSPNGMAGNLRALERKGFLRRGERGTSRGILLADEARCPACGQTIHAQEHSTEGRS